MLRLTFFNQCYVHGFPTSLEINLLANTMGVTCSAKHHMFGFLRWLWKTFLFLFFTIIHVRLIGVYICMHCVLNYTARKFMHSFCAY